MITVHHLNDSRSQRVLWLLEELGVPYEVKLYQRDPKTGLAPAELKSVSPLGKSPFITDDGLPVRESGAIIDYLIRHYGNGRMQPDPATPAYDEYVQWLHYAEGSAMWPLLSFMQISSLGPAGAPLMPRIESELANHLGFIERTLMSRRYLMGDELTGADMIMMDIGELLRRAGRLSDYPAIAGWFRDVQSRPAFRAAMKRGGPFGDQAA